MSVKQTVAVVGQRRETGAQGLMSLGGETRSRGDAWRRVSLTTFLPRLRPEDLVYILLTPILLYHF